MGKIDYKKLYLLQDRVLKSIFSSATEFYLTGGTCLNRFYFEKRISDDLDFFTNSSSTFHFSLKEVISELYDNGLSPIIKTESKDFVRMYVKNNQQNLQLDFSNDRVKRFGDIVQKNNFSIDNPLNILSNKLTAVLSRDNPKDIFDIFLISKNMVFNWKIILLQASERIVFQKEDLIFRLSDFPVESLKNIKLIEKDYLSNFKAVFDRIILEIESELENTQYKKVK